MKRTVLATLIALSIPAAAAADESRMMRPPMPRPADEIAAPATLRGDRQDVRELDRLVSRYDEAAFQRDRRTMARLEGKLLAAIDGEIAEARAAVARFSRRGHGAGYGYGQPVFERRRLEAARADLSRLTALRAEFVGLQGRFSPRATTRKQAVVAEVSRLARADLAALPPPAPRPPRSAWNDHR